MAPGAAERDGDTDAGDIAETDRGGQRGAEGLKVRNLTRILFTVVFATNDLHPVSQGAPLDEFGDDREKQAATEQEKEEVWCPNDAVEPSGEVLEMLHAVVLE